MLCLMQRPDQHRWRRRRRACFRGQHYRGSGDAEYFDCWKRAPADVPAGPELQESFHALRAKVEWLVRGRPGRVVIQNSYGTTYAILPLLQEAVLTFLQNAQDLCLTRWGTASAWGPRRRSLVAPDGCLCDAARPGWIVYKQGDGAPPIHDWHGVHRGGMYCRAELLLINGMPRPLRITCPCWSAAPTSSRRAVTPRTTLFLAGPAGNLLGPELCGVEAARRQPTTRPTCGALDHLYCALDRLIELEKLAGGRRRRALTCNGAPGPTRAGAAHDGRGLFHSLADPDGVRHAVVWRQAAWIL